MQCLENQREIYVNRIVNKIGNPERVTTCTLKASLDYQGVKFEIDENGFSSKQVTISGGFFSGCRTAYSFDDNSMRFG